MIRMMALALLIGVACGNVKDNGPRDAAIDAPAIDAPPPPPPPPHASREIVSGSARMSGATYTLDVQVGHALQQSNITGPTRKLESNAAVRP